MTNNIYDKMRSYSENYAKNNLVTTTMSLKKDERTEIRDKLCLFVSSIPHHWPAELKLRLVYSVITKLVSYDKRDSDDENPVRFTYIGCLERKAVCMGIAEMMTILCKGMGIKAVTVIGFGGNFAEDKKNGPHAWNIVWLPNAKRALTPYHLDATWDLHKAYCRFDYYLKTDAYMRNHNHIWLSERYPVCLEESHYKAEKINERLVDMACQIFPKTIPSS